MKILKIVLMVLASLLIGMAIAGYFTGVRDPSPLASVGKALTSLKQSIGQALVGKIPAFNAPGALPQEGYPTPGVTMSPAEVANTEKYFNKLSGVDMEKKKKEEEEKKAKDAKDKGAKKKDEHDIKIPASLFPIPKRRKSIEDSDTGETGAVYAMGTRPYGPPPDVKAKILNSDSLLYVDNDPQASLEDYVDDQRTYHKPQKPLVFEKKAPPQEHSLPTLDHKEGFRIQFGAFEKEERAHKLKKIMIAKGYDVGVYKEPTPQNGVEKMWYYVRLNKIMTEKEAHIHEKEIQKKDLALMLIVPIHKEIK